MPPVIMGNADRPELGQELTNSFCRTDPDIAMVMADPVEAKSNPRAAGLAFVDATNERQRRRLN
jgi:hypothetical protein